jgi:hypothetical protein
VLDDMDQARNPEVKVAVAFAASWPDLPLDMLLTTIGAREDTELAARLRDARRHELRIALVADLRRIAPASPARLAEAQQVPESLVHYHLRPLVQAGLVAQVSTEPAVPSATPSYAATALGGAWLRAARDGEDWAPSCEYALAPNDRGPLALLPALARAGSAGITREGLRAELVSRGATGRYLDRHILTITTLRFAELTLHRRRGSVKPTYRVTDKGRQLARMIEMAAEPSVAPGEDQPR